MLEFERSDNWFAQVMSPDMSWHFLNIHGLLIAIQRQLGMTNSANNQSYGLQNVQIICLTVIIISKYLRFYEISIMFGDTMKYMY